MEFFKPSYVSPVVVWLSHESCPENGGVFETAGGYVGKYRWQRSAGKVFSPPNSITPESVRDFWPQITDMSRTNSPNSFQGMSLSNMPSIVTYQWFVTININSEHTLTLVNTLKANMENKEEIQESSNEVIVQYSVDDAILYALSGNFFFVIR